MRSPSLSMLVGGLRGAEARDEAEAGGRHGVRRKAWREARTRCHAARRADER